MPFWLILGIALWLGSIFVAICLAKAAARGDEGLKVERSPLAREIEEWLAARDRTYKRQGIQHLGKTRLGIDP